MNHRDSEPIAGPLRRAGAGYSAYLYCVACTARLNAALYDAYFRFVHDETCPHRFRDGLKPEGYDSHG